MYPLESLTVRVGGIQIAYAQELRLEKTIEGVRSLVIGHFATEAGMQRLGVGTAFAFAIGQAVADVYRGSQIIFAERTDRPHNRKFFEALGAHAVFLQSELTPRWHWKLPDFSTTTVSGP